MATIKERPSGIQLSDGLASAIGLPGYGLRVVLERSGSAMVVHAGGSVDASNVEVWRRLVDEAARITSAPGSLIIDTSGLEFMAVCAFAVLVEQSARCRGRGIRLCLVSNQRVAGRVVKAAGLDTELSFSANIDDAVGDAPRDDSGPLRGSSA